MATNRTITGGSGSLQLKTGALVYRVYDRHGALLYIGVTEDICMRMTAHRNDKHWWGHAARVEWDEYPSRLAALNAEGKLIQRHRPPYNKHMNGGWHVTLTPDDSHEPGCPEGAQLAHQCHSPVDRLLRGGAR